MKEIKLPTGHVTIVDDDTYEWASKLSWHLNSIKHGYVRRSYRDKASGVTISPLMHREIMNVTDKNLVVDHINRNKLDNRKSNLRICTPLQNKWNKKKGKAKYVGVAKCGYAYTASISTNGIITQLGKTTTMEAAALLYNIEAVKRRGEFAFLNNVSPDTKIEFYTPDKRPKSMKDPSVLFYWNDWYGGTAILTRHQKGCYMDLLHAQFNNGHLSLEQIKTVLGSDFSNWNAIQKKFKVDNEGNFYNERLEEEMNRRKKYTKSRRDNLKGSPPHMEIEDEVNTGISSSVLNKKDGHEIFGEKLLANQLEVEAIEVSTRAKLTPELIKQFNANLTNSCKEHAHYSEYKRHLQNWLPKKQTDEKRTNPAGSEKIGRITVDAMQQWLDKNIKPDLAEDTGGTQ